MQWARLVAWAANHDVRIDVVAVPGTSVIAGNPVLRITGSGPVRDDTDDSRFAGLLKSSVVFGAARTPHQDVDFALQQLVEIGVRGLASGTNDPCTAVNALELSATALVPLWGSRTAITAYTDDDGAVRVTPHWPSAETLVDGVFDVFTHGSEDPIVLAAARSLAERLEEVAPEERRAHIWPVVERVRSEAA